MNSVLFFLDLRIKRLSTVMWLAAVIALVLMYVALYPSIKSTPGVDEFIQNLPEALREAFAIADYSSPTGYLQAEIFSGLLPVVLLVLVIGRGSASVAGEEDQKRLEIVMAQPVSRVSLYLSKAASLTVISLLMVFFGVFGTIALVGPWVSITVGLADLFAICFHLFVFVLFAGFLALAAGAASGRKGLGVALASADFALGFLIESLGRSIDWLGRLRPLSPWRWYSSSQPLSNGIDWGDCGVLVGSALAVLCLGAWLFNRRDLRG